MVERAILVSRQLSAMLRPGADSDGRIRASRPGCVSHSPLYKLELQRLLADTPFQRRDPGFILLKKIRRGLGYAGN
jgi:hypothetical protein